MLCAKCGANNPTESTFCGDCGSSLTPMQDARSAVPVFPEQVPSATPPLQAAMQDSDETPTLRSPLEQTFVASPVTPAVNESMNVGGPAQDTPASTPNYVNDTYQGQAPTVQSSFSGANYPTQDAAMPGYPSGANYPPQGAAMPGYPSGANYPPQGAAMPGYPSGANYPQGVLASGAYPGQPSQPNWGGYPGMVPQQPVKQPSKLIQALPLWITIVNSIIVASVLAALMFFTGSDWAAGAQVAGIISLVLGLLMLIAFGVRSALGMLASTNTHRLSQAVSAILLTLLLFGYGAFGMTGQSTIHTLQAHALEGQQNWQNAIDEYMAGGQNKPASADIARTYNEWGESLRSQQKFDAALANFNIVMTDYSQATAQVTQAQTDAIATFQSWGSFSAQQKNYADATQHYDDLLKQLYCDTPCKNSTKTLDATAYFNLAEQQLTAGKFSNAVSAFNKLTTDPNLKGSSEATKVHGDYAKALLGAGKQALTTTCSSAVPLYQQLSTSFSDTPEGQQATQALAAPVPVKGHFTTTIPGGTNTPQVGLPQGVTASMTPTQFYAILANSPVQQVQSDGSFSFPSVKQGSYFLVWGVQNSADSQQVFLVGQRYPAVVAPLCTFDFGDISEAFPTA
jgi:hypothetical protein